MKKFLLELYLIFQIEYFVLFLYFTIYQSIRISLLGYFITYVFLYLSLSFLFITGLSIFITLKMYLKKKLYKNDKIINILYLFGFILYLSVLSGNLPFFEQLHNFYYMLYNTQIEL